MRVFSEGSGLMANAVDVYGFMQCLAPTLTALMFTLFSMVVVLMKTFRDCRVKLDFWLVIVVNVSKMEVQA